MRELKDLHIMIAEDDPDDAEFVCQSFKKHPSFALVSLFRNGRDLFDALREFRPDVILTDINMPKMNGIELLEAISGDADLCSIPVFTYSSTNNPYYEEKCISLGSIGFISKPYSLSEFDHIPILILRHLEARQVYKAGRV